MSRIQLTNALNDLTGSLGVRYLGEFLLTAMVVTILDSCLPFCYAILGDNPREKLI